MKNNVLVKSASFLFHKSFKLILIVIMVCCFSFILLQYSPIDPVRAYIGADMQNISNDQKMKIAIRWGLDQPPLIRFGKWFSQLAQGNFGTSMIFNEPVIDVIGKRFKTSLSLMFFAWLLSGIFGFVLGVISGVYNKRMISKIIDLYSYTLASTPVFWLGIVFLVVFSVMLQWTPVGGAMPAGMLPDQVSVWERIHHLLLPCITLSIVSVANITLHTKEKVMELMQSDFVTFAIAQGETNYGIIKHHIVRNALLPAISIHFGFINEIFGGSVLIEQVFAYPGIGKAAVDAGIRGDVPLLLGITIFSTIFVYCGNVIADYSYQVIDPRIRFKESADV